mgnify:CR=1 FL=1
MDNWGQRVDFGEKMGKSESYPQHSEIFEKTSEIIGKAWEILGG